MAAKVPVYGIVEFSHQKSEVFFYANELRIHLESHQFINTPHKHSTYITILFIKGKGEHQIDFDTYAIKPGSVFLLSPGQVHCWKVSKDAEGFVFFHTKEFYDNIFLKRKIENYPFFYLQQNYPVIYLSISDTKRVERNFQEIYQEYKERLKGWEIKLEALADLVYIELSRLYTNKTENGKISDPSYLKVKKLQKFIDEYFKSKKFPSDYADLMNMSTRHLSRICREVLNKSTGDLIIERILIEARRLLIQKDITVAMVADELGYDDYSYFIRMFKKNTGVSPKEFQASIHNPFD
jgi:AraC family transcriptional regulator, transcriptional activator of pobA